MDSTVYLTKKKLLFFSREPYYITRRCCSWPVLLLPVVQGASRTRTITTLDAMAEVFSDARPKTYFNIIV